jgi:hypothetical protein
MRASARSAPRRASGLISGEVKYASLDWSARLRSATRYSLPRRDHGLQARRGDGRSIEVAGFANAGHAVQEVEKRCTLGELQGVVRRQMDMHIDKSGQGETSGKLGRRPGGRVGNSRNRAAGYIKSRAGAPVVHRVDDGDAGDLEATLGETPGRARSPQSKPVEKTHRKTLRITPLTIMNMNIYSCCGQCEPVFILSTGHTEV